MRLQDQVAAMPGFVEMWRAGVSVKEIAERLGLNVYTVRNAAKQLKVLHPNANQVGLLAVAPSDDEERLSQDTLALAPSVSVLAAKVKRKALAAYQRGESSPYCRRNYKKRT